MSIYINITIHYIILLTLASQQISPVILYHHQMILKTHSDMNSTYSETHHYYIQYAYPINTNTYIHVHTYMYNIIIYLSSSS